MRPPLRIVLVHHPREPLADWVSRLLVRLIDDPAFSFIGCMTGERMPVSRKPLPMILKIERSLILMRYAKYYSAKAADFVSGLEKIDAKTASRRADLVLALGDRRLSDAELSALDVPEWSLLLANAPPADAGKAAMAAISAKAPLVPVTLVERAGTSASPQPLCTAQYNVKPSAMLLAEFLKEKAVLFLHRMLMCRAHGESVNTGAVVADDAPPVAPAPWGSNGAQYTLGLFRVIGQRASEALSDRLGRPAFLWELRLGEGTPEDFDPKTGRKLPGLPPSVADPFLFAHGGVLYVFYEAILRPNQNAWIEVARLDGDRLVPLGAVLRGPHHISFPHVFAHDGEVYMMPETQQLNRLEIWRARNFPLEWELHATALHGRCPADSSLLHHDGQWWLFSNLSDHHAMQEHGSELYLFAVDGPDLKKLTDHPANPVVIGSNVARNAGPVTKMNGRLYRPSQNNSHGIYGYGLNLMRIDRLDRSGYSETLVKSITPGMLPEAVGVHHISFSGGRYVMDVYRHSPDQAPALPGLARRLRASIASLGQDRSGGRKTIAPTPQKSDRWRQTDRA